MKAITLQKLRQHIEAITLLTDQEFDYVKSFFTVKKVRKHQYLLQEGEPVLHEYVVLSGIFRMFYLDNDGKEHIIQFAGTDWWMSDYNAYFTQTNATLHIVCMEEGEVLCLKLAGREQLSKEMHKMEHFFRVKLTRGYAAQQKRIISLLSGTPQQRYEEFCELYPQISQTIPKKYIAEYLGVSRETLSRLYK